MCECVNVLISIPPPPTHTHTHRIHSLQNVDVKITLKAIKAINTLINVDYMPEAIFEHLGPVLEVLIHLSGSADANVQLEVIWALTTLFNTQVCVCVCIKWCAAHCTYADTHMCI
jgi:hypothetical protein